MKIEPTNIGQIRSKIVDEILPNIESKKKAGSAFVTEEEWEEFKTYAKGRPSFVDVKLRDICYKRFYQGFSFQEIATKFSLDINQLLYTAYAEDWFDKILKEKKVRGSESVERLDKSLYELLADIVDATQSSYTYELAQALRDPASGRASALIPKSIKELQILFSIVQSLQTKEPPSEKGSSPSSVVNVNVNSLLTGAGASAVNTTLDGKQEDILSFLLEATKTEGQE